MLVVVGLEQFFLTGAYVHVLLNYGEVGFWYQADS
jgi:hypothetical protein